MRAPPALPICVQSGRRLGGGDEYEKRHQRFVLFQVLQQRRLVAEAEDLRLTQLDQVDFDPAQVENPRSVFHHLHDGDGQATA